MKYNKFLIIIMITLLMVLSSCSKTKEVVIINKIYNEVIDVDDNINITSLEDLLCEKYEIVSPYSVGISATSNKIINVSSEGSGVIVYSAKKNQSYILTNKHIIISNNTPYTDINVYYQNYYFNATIEYISEEADIALLVLDTDIIKGLEIKEASLKVGQFVFTISYPYQMETLTNTFTFGNISGLNRQLNDETTLYLQHTATINHGSSGSGLFNLKGELIGINTMKIINSSNGYEELNFAIDINTIITCLGEYF